MSNSEWKNYYKNNFAKELEKANKMRTIYFNQSVSLNAHEQEKELCMQYAELFYSTCTLLKYFMAYNGLFQFENREIIREAFYIEMINDGELWINALSLIEVMETYGYEQVKELILEYFEDKYFHIFEELNTKFEALEGENV